MPYLIPIEEAQRLVPEYIFISALTPSEQKAAFHVKNSEGHDYCLKIISPDYSLDRINREILALQSLKHPNIVNLIEYTFSSKINQQRHYIVEEFIEGCDLYDLIGKKPWSKKDTSLLFAQIFDGLEALNLKNLVHRDLKPKNIRVRKNGSPVIIDFGLARHLSLNDLTRTEQGATIGTPQYFAPEQFQGSKRDIDHRTDIFATGIILYETLIGFHPFHKKMTTYEELMEAICSSDDYSKEQDFQSLPPKWQIFLNRLLSKDRIKRPTAGQSSKIIRQLGEI